MSINLDVERSPTKNSEVRQSPTSVELCKTSCSKGLCVSPTSSTKYVYITPNTDYIFGQKI